MGHHGVRYLDRRAILREKVLAMQSLWTNEEAAFDGTFVEFEASWAWPKPVQDPHPPIILGGAPGPRTFSDVVEFCDGWMPIYGRYDIIEKIADLRHSAEDARRDPATIEVGVFSAPPDRATLERLAAAGVARAVLALPASPRDEVIPLLDEYAALLGE